ncbi:MAG: endonuclease/exonuclease/phosphatase family protein [Wenzhouxiangella sp.]
MSIRFAVNSPSSLSSLIILLSFWLAAPALADHIAIAEIHGEGHISAALDREVTTEGIVTLVADNTVWIQTAGEAGLRSGLAIEMSQTPQVARGDRIRVSGRIEQQRPENRPQDLAITRLVEPRIEILASGQPLPEPVLIGPGGREIPSALAPEHFDGPLQPEANAIDFWTALKGMRVALTANRVVGPTSRFHSTWLIAAEEHRNLGRHGTVAVGPEDLNPERVQVQAHPLLIGDFPEPAWVGDRFAAVGGIVDYRFGDFRIMAEHALRLIPGDRADIRSRLVGDAEHLLIASYNVENLSPHIESFSRVRSPRDVDDAVGSGRMDEIARHIVEALNAPDILGLQEIQDGDGAEDTELVSAELTLIALTEAIVSAGGPQYAWIDFPPERNADGGQPGGNIRNVFLYNPQRVQRGVESARRIEGRAFSDSRKPVVSEFIFNGQPVVLINNHFSAKSGSDPLFGIRHPRVERRADQREAQAQAILRFAAGLDAQRRDRLVVLGDLNDHWFSAPLAILTGDETVPLHNLGTDLPPEERFSFIFQGNAQAIDHILVSRALAGVSEFEIVHVNSPNPRQAADHDPLLARLWLPPSD